MTYKIGDCVAPKIMPAPSGNGIIYSVTETNDPDLQIIGICTDYGNMIHTLNNKDIDYHYTVTQNQSIRDWFNDRQQLTVAMYQYLYGLKLL